MRRVVLESPYAGDIEANIEYARECLKHSLELGEAPIASHLLYTQPGVLDDSNAEQRKLGISAGHKWIALADYLVVYVDLGISNGMKQAIDLAEIMGVNIKYRSIKNIRNVDDSSS